VLQLLCAELAADGFTDAQLLVYVDNREPLAFTSSSAGSRREMPGRTGEQGSLSNGIASCSRDRSSPCLPGRRFDQERPWVKAPHRVRRNERQSSHNNRSARLI